MTRKQRKSLGFLAIGVITVLTLSDPIGRFVFGVTREHLTREFRKNIVHFSVVASFLKNSDEEFFIERDGARYIAKVSTGGQGMKIVSIPDPEVERSIRFLFNRLHYEFIIEDGGNGIYFMLEDTGLGFGHGVAFSKDGKTPVRYKAHLDVIEQISSEWYYFERE